MIRSLAVLLAALSLGAGAQAASPSPAPSVLRGSPAPARPSPPRPARGPTPAPASPAPAAFDLGVWTVHASSLDANFKTGDFSTPAKIVMTRTGGDVSADRANGNYKKQVLYLNGHVVMHDQQGGAAGGMGATGGRSSGPSTLTADRAEIDGRAKIYKAMGNVRYVQAETVVTADNGTLDDAAHTLLLEGAVHIVSGTRSMNANRVLYNTATGKAHAQGDVTMQFPGAFHGHLATPKPLKVPKNPVMHAAPPGGGAR